MATFTKRISANLEAISDKYNSHWSPTWIAESSIYGESGQIGVFTETEDFPGEWSGGVRNASYRFTNITIPQGSVITSAYITYVRGSGSSNTFNFNYKYIGVDEDDTGTLTSSDTCRTRTHTTASVDWDFTLSPGSSGDIIYSPDISNIIQEIIDRVGWTSGNDLGLYLFNDGTSAQNYFDYRYYSSYPTLAPLLTIEYETGGSPSPSPSPSLSPSSSISSSISPSLSASLSVSLSPSSSISPTLPPGEYIGLKIAKVGFNVLTEDEPFNFIFNSKYGTLKYFTKQSIQISFDASTLDISAKGEYAHNLGYYPYVEVYVSVNGGAYEYCPYFGAGATVFYSANYKITTDKITVYGEINGVSTSTWTFDFIVFIFKNNLNL